jgi:Tfp pilus assembly protein PilF
VTRLSRWRGGCHRWNWIVPVAVAASTAAAFLPALGNGFVSWDDLGMFPGNPHYRGPVRATLWFDWTTFHIGEYMPVTWMTYSLDAALWGLDPFGYHLTSLGLHVLAAVAVYVLARQLLGSTAAARQAGPVGLTLAAGVTALLFALHPLRAEPVAWVSARGSVLGGLFAVLAVSAYLARHARQGRARGRWYPASLALFALALLCRSTNVMLPAVLLVLDVYPLGRLGRPPDGFLGRAAWRVYGEKLPFVGLAAATAWLAVMARSETGGVFGRQPLDPAAGAAVASFALVRYLGQTLLVAGPSSPLNEMPLRLDPFEWRFMLSGALVIALTAVLALKRRRWPAVVAAWVTYGAVLAPTLGAVPFGVQMTADRYTYVSCLPWAVLGGRVWLGWWLRFRQGRVGHVPWTAGAALLVLLLLGLGALSWHRVQVWRDSRTLWRYTLALEPRSVIAHLSLGLVLERDGDLASAERHFRRAAELAPHDATARTNLGRTLLRQNRPAEAAGELGVAARLAPQFADSHLTLGGALAAQGRLEEAVESYRRALSLRPMSAAVHFNLARALAGLGRLVEAAQSYRAAVSIEPGFTEAHLELERVLRRLEGPSGTPPAEQPAPPPGGPRGRGQARDLSGRNCAGARCRGLLGYGATSERPA